MQETTSTTNTHRTGAIRATLFVTLAVLACVCLLGLLGCQVDVPNLKGMTLTEAADTLGAAELALGNVTYDTSSAEETWTIIAQSVTDKAPAETVVDLTLAGPPPTTVPDLAATDSLEASAALAAASLRVGVVTESYDESSTPSAVISQTPLPGEIVAEGGAVSFLVSLGPKPPPADTLTMKQVDRIVGAYSPKSVVASQVGHVFAQNMIYRHTITVFDDETHEVLETIPDEVALAEYGFSGYSGTVEGGPVEAAVTPDGKYMYVSNYSMYGPGFSRPGDDVGGPGSGVDPSFVYRIPTDTLEIDQVIKVGSVPKFLAVTPDGRYGLVSNWISYTLSVVDIESGAEIEQIKLGRYPRGIAVSPDSKTAYVAVMGSRDIAMVDLDTFEVSWIKGVGASPRHLNISPDGQYLYSTLNGEGRVVKIDLATGEVINRVATGSQPRSMTISQDGTSLYVVNYSSDSVSKLRTSDMHELQELPTSHHPIGITYVNETGEIWVACYSGAFHVFAEE